MTKEHSLGFIFESDSFFCFFGNRNAQLPSLKLAFPNFQFIRIKQTHGDICVISDSTDMDYQIEADAHLSQKEKLALCISTADCTPIMIYAKNSSRQAIAGIHAGWRGVANAITAKTIQKIIALGFSPGDLSILIGPHILYSSFEVSSDVKDLLCRDSKIKNAVVKDLENKKHLIDLHGLLIEQCENLEIQRDQINTLYLDTKTNTAFHSYRRDKEMSGRQISFIALK